MRFREAGPGGRQSALSPRLRPDFGFLQAGIRFRVGLPMIAERAGRRCHRAALRAVSGEAEVAPDHKAFAPHRQPIAARRANGPSFLDAFTQLRERSVEARERGNDIQRRPVQCDPRPAPPVLRVTLVASVPVVHVSGLRPPRRFVRLDKTRQEWLLLLGCAIDYMAVDVEPVVPAKQRHECSPHFPAMPLPYPGLCATTSAPGAIWNLSARSVRLGAAVAKLAAAHARAKGRHRGVIRPGIL
jgi:hypothetical protein